MAARGSDAMDDDYCEEVYSVEDDSAVEEEEEEEFVYEGEDDEDGPVMPPMPKLRRAVSHDFDVLDSDGLKQSMEEELSRAVETLGVPFSVACALLRHFAWNFGRMAEAYCEDSEKVRGHVLTRPPVLGIFHGVSIVL